MPGLTKERIGHDYVALIRVTAHHLAVRTPIASGVDELIAAGESALRDCSDRQRRRFLATGVAIRRAMLRRLGELHARE